MCHHSEFGKKFLIRGQEIFIVVDTGKCFGYTQIVGYHTGSHIYAFVWSNGNKQVCSAYAALFEVVYGGRVASTCHKVVHIEVL